MKLINQTVWGVASLLSLSFATSAQADFVIPTLQQIQDKQAAIRFCNDYADVAIEQFAKSKTLSCGFSGPRWNNDRQGQFNWCLTVLEPFAITERGFREDALKTCQENKSSGNNPQNQISIPQACKDPTKAYTSVKQINHHFRYETNLTSPVQNGLISYDYNRDRKADYVFLETKDDSARVAMCFSQGQRYRRQVTDITFYSGSGGLGSSKYEITQQGDTLVVTIDEFEHNAGSSYRQVSYRFDPSTSKFKIIKNESDVYPVIYDGQPYPMGAPVTPKLF
ncbi:hypothetical protein [Leucothrix pacifica]|uniref:Uncharacterized protein n=1 Tax=Leucothrix pacifica TaxID=1247513 RepID=A0A317C0Q2_9GAMM|nr:hypothetical protein [Leucothrix pacifica]PWQ92234.1 hypothetical protein DKW60_22250 [Leucothrix pacifica]